MLLIKKASTVQYRIHGKVAPCQGLFMNYIARDAAVFISKLNSRHVSLQFTLGLPTQSYFCPTILVTRGAICDQWHSLSRSFVF